MPGLLSRLLNRPMGLEPGEDPAPPPDDVMDLLPFGPGMLQPTAVPAGLSHALRQGSRGLTRLYHGEGGPASGGSGGGWFSPNPQRAASYGKRVGYVDVPQDVYGAGRQAARQAGSGTGGDAHLSHWWQRLMRAYDVTPTRYDIGG